MTVVCFFSYTDQFSDSPDTNGVPSRLVLTVYPELAWTPQVKDSVPQNCPRYRHTSPRLRLPPRLLSLPSAVNWGLPPLLPPIWPFARTAHRAQESILPSGVVIIKDTTPEQPAGRGAQGTTLLCPLWAAPSSTSMPSPTRKLPRTPEGSIV